jgi:hypothetical protein
MRKRLQFHVFLQVRAEIVDDMASFCSFEVVQIIKLTGSRDVHAAQRCQKTRHMVAQRIFHWNRALPFVRS